MSYKKLELLTTGKKKQQKSKQEKPNTQRTNKQTKNQ
jgi:hypothetical protein